VPVWGFMLAAILVGALVSAQPPMNAILARAIGNPFGAAAISIFVAFACAIAALLFTGTGDLSRGTLAAVPWWVYLAGTVGLIFVAGGIVIAPVTGALLFFVCVVGGQLLGATLADHLGAFGLQVRPVSPQRIAGLALVLAGAILVQRG
jgi:bacterial/archaeal transporter family-2 protein